MHSGYSRKPEHRGKSVKPAAQSVDFLCRAAAKGQHTKGLLRKSSIMLSKESLDDGANFIFASRLHRLNAKPVQGGANMSSQPARCHGTRWQTTESTTESVIRTSRNVASQTLLYRAVTVEYGKPKPTKELCKRRNVIVIMKERKVTAC